MNATINISFHSYIEALSYRIAVRKFPRTDLPPPAAPLIPGLLLTNSLNLVAPVFTPFPPSFPPSALFVAAFCVRKQPGLQNLWSRVESMERASEGRRERLLRSSPFREVGKCRAALMNVPAARKMVRIDLNADARTKADCK